MGSADEQGKLWGASVVDWAQYAEPHHEPYWRGMLADMSVQKGTRVLDTGCGAGGGGHDGAEPPLARRDQWHVPQDAGEAFHRSVDDYARKQMAPKIWHHARVS